MALVDEYDLIITGGICVTASDTAPLDIAIKDEKIVLLAPSGTLKDAKALRVIDAEGGYVMVCPSLCLKPSHLMCPPRGTRVCVPNSSNKCSPQFT